MRASAGHRVLVGLSDLRHDHPEHALLHEPAHDVSLTGGGSQRGHHASPRRAAGDSGIEPGILLPLPALRLVPAPGRFRSSSCSSTSKRTKGCENRSARFHSLSRTSLEEFLAQNRFPRRSTDARPRDGRPLARGDRPARVCGSNRARDRPRGRTASTREIGGRLGRRSTSRNVSRSVTRLADSTEVPTLLNSPCHLSSSASVSGARDERARGPRRVG